MSRKDGEKVLSEMNAFVLNADAAVPADGADENELPFESIDDFSTDPLTFQETAVMVWRKTEYLFGLSAKYNRRSAKYLDICGRLEKGIKYLGSCCLTMEVMKQKRYQLPELEGLSTHWLFGLVSFNTRKLDAVVNAAIEASQDLPEKWLDMQFRFLNLAERLKATERKIYECYTHPDSALGTQIFRQANLFTKDACNRSYVRRNIQPPVFRSGTALPLLKEALREEPKAQEPAAPVENTVTTETGNGDSPEPDYTGTLWEKNEAEDLREFYLSKPLGELNAMREANNGEWERAMDAIFGKGNWPDLNLKDHPELYLSDDEFSDEFDGELPDFPEDVDPPWDSP